MQIEKVFVDEMQYIPKLTPEEIEQNHKCFKQRISLYKEKGLDFVKSRGFILEKAGPLQGSILEIGTGTGYTTLILARAGYKFISIDKDKEALKIAALNLAYENALPCVKFYVMDGQSMSFANDSFKNVIVVSLFHHIDNVDGILSEIDRVLCINGKLILADFNRKGMEVVNSVHRQEGRTHQDSGVSRDYISSYLYKLGYEIRNYEEEYHWVLIAAKKIKP